MVWHKPDLKRRKKNQLVFTLTIARSGIPPTSFHTHSWGRCDIPVPRGSAFLGIAQNLLSCVLWALLPLLPSSRTALRKHHSAAHTIYPGEGISQPALENKCYKEVIVHAVSMSPGKRAYRYNSILSVGHLPVMVGVLRFLCTASKQHIPFISNPQGWDIHNLLLNPDVFFHLASLQYRPAWPMSSHHTTCEYCSRSFPRPSPSPSSWIALEKLLHQTHWKQPRCLRLWLYFSSLLKETV